MVWNSKNRNELSNVKKGSLSTGPYAACSACPSNILMFAFLLLSRTSVAVAVAVAVAVSARFEPDKEAALHLTVRGVHGCFS